MRLERLAWPLTIISGILLIGILLYMFGTPASAPPRSTDASGLAATGGESQGEAAPPGSDGAPPMGEVIEGEAPPPDPSSPLAIEIPGCVCHSDDAEIVAEHEEYRMNQCAGCHIGGMHDG